jgi:hypothetical protein
VTNGRGLAVTTVGWAVIGLLVGHIAVYPAGRDRHIRPVVTHASGRRE